MGGFNDLAKQGTDNLRDFNLTHYETRTVREGGCDPAWPCPAHLTGIRARAEPGRGITGLEGGRKPRGRGQRVINTESDVREENPEFQEKSKEDFSGKDALEPYPPAALVSEQVVPEGDSYQSSAQRGEKAVEGHCFRKSVEKAKSPASHQARFQVEPVEGPGSRFLRFSWQLWLSPRLGGDAGRGATVAHVMKGQGDIMEKKKTRQETHVLGRFHFSIWPQTNGPA